MKKLDVIRVTACATLIGLYCLTLNFSLAATQPNKPFPQQVNYAGIVKPNHVTQKQMDTAVSTYYDTWKNTYLKELKFLPGGYYVKGDITGDPEGFIAVGTSEGQGYGMIITALMAGHDPNAQKYFNGLFKTARAFKSSVNSKLMGWVVADNAKAQGKFSSATDGDLDIAYSLLLAHDQWGSKGEINYLQEAITMINAIKSSNVTKDYRLNLGDWAKLTSYDSRPSDWMMSHIQSFYDATDDATWLAVKDNLYTLYNSFVPRYSATTGLISDFVIDNPVRPAGKNFLDESSHTNAYYYNSSRVPLRIVMDYAMNQDTRAKTIADKLASFIIVKTNGSPSKIRDGYELNGNVFGGYATAVFVSPFVASATSNGQNQTFINNGWDWMKAKKENYFSDTYNLMTMLFISGNWWKPLTAGEVQPEPEPSPEPEPPPPVVQMPNPPTNLRVSDITQTSAYLTFNASTGNAGIVQYKVTNYRGSQIASAVTIQNTSTLLSDLRPNTSYKATINAVDTLGNMSQPISITYTTLPDVVVPPPGVENNVPEWDAKKTYSVPGTAVKFGDDVYENLWWLNPGQSPDVYDRHGENTGWKMVDGPSLKAIMDWRPNIVYKKLGAVGDKVLYKNKIYEAQYWTKGDTPDQSGDWGPWKLVTH